MARKTFAPNPGKNSTAGKAIKAATNLRGKGGHKSVSSFTKSQGVKKAKSMVSKRGR